MSNANDAGDGTRDNLLHLLDAEISDGHAKASRWGWTNQATIGALGLVAWMLLEALQRESLHVQAAALLFACTWLLWEGLKTYRSPVWRKAARRAAPAQGRIVEIAPLVAASRSALLVALVFDSAILAVVFGTAISLPWSVHVVVVIAASLQVAATAAGLAVSFARELPISTSAENIVVRFATGFALTLGTATAAAATAVLVSMWSTTARPTMPELQCAALAFAIRFLTEILVGRLAEPANDETLVTIRRRWLLGEITEHEARQRTERAILGAKTDDYMRGPNSKAAMFERDCLLLQEELATIEDQVSALGSAGTHSDADLERILKAYSRLNCTAITLTSRATEIKSWIAALTLQDSGSRDSAELAKATVDQAVTLVFNVFDNLTAKLLALGEANSNTEP